MKGCVFMDFFGAVSLFLSLLILCGGIFFTLYLKGFFFIHPIRTLREMFKRTAKNGISPLRALSASLSGTLGVGNIVGVAVAIIIGGAGAVFWIWASALISMVLKYCEITLGVRYRRRTRGRFEGGPMFYMRDGVGGKAGKACAFLFSLAGVVSSFALGNIVQISAACDSANIIFGADKTVFAAVGAAVTALIIWGGFERISRVTSVVLPIISGIYLALCVCAILLGHAFIPAVIKRIFSEAFAFDSAVGGIFGFLLSPNVLQGVAKGTFSHESGSGTAPIAHANAETDLPSRQGLLGLFEVFADTVIICSLSAFVILIAREQYVTDTNGMALVLAAFENGLGAWTKYVVGVSIVIFAYATTVCWAFYGRSCLAYLSHGEKAGRIYLLAYIAFAVIGASLSQDTVWKTADTAVSLMTATNMPALFLLRKKIREETEVIFP